MSYLMEDEGSMSERRCCKTCRWWNVHSLRMNRGDCMNGAGHGYSRVRMGDGTVALFDTFGNPETGPQHVCAEWERGETRRLQKKGVEE